MSDIRWARSPDVLSRRCIDGVLLLPIDGEDVVALSASAAVIWQQLTTLPVTTADIVRALAPRYAVSPQSLTSEVDAALVALAEHGAVLRVP